MVDGLDNLNVEDDSEEVETDMKKLIEKVIAALKSRDWTADEILKFLEEILG